MRLILAVIAYIATIVAANYAATRWGLVPVGFDLVAPAGVYFAGLALLARDVLQDVGGRALTVGAIIVGALLSAALADPLIATASAIAFLVSEFVDMLIYTPLRHRGWARAVIASNLAGAIVDSVIFLWIAPFPLTTLAVIGQLLGKTWATLISVALVIGGRHAIFRNREHARNT